ncbi:MULTISPECIES: copper resistance CopC family protein [unclassified Streptomyces]|uniref:copper resistance CopC family protein n=1 Tax=unclassified Streptomyces TaxID=2593676 RepID=UPI000978E15A|nr:MULTISPECIES: copper resistance CopC family protein [unclassified Streptomyces]ONI49975.1 Copper resistance protein C [Streptomyces sp. IB2014 011-1]RDV48544.1 copper resistance protein CopC [Streptomyces sp. IB2014 011-12]
MHYTYGRVRFAARALVAPAALGILVAGAPLAAAHTDLDSSAPVAEASLAEMPESVTLTFSDPMDQKYAKVAVTGPDKKPAGQGTPRVDGKRVTIALDPQGSAGEYSVGYRVVSADGHPVSGSYTFTVQTRKASPGPTASASELPTAPTTQPPASGAQAAPDSGGSAGMSTAAVTAAGVLMAVGAAGYLMLWRKRVSRDD